MSGRGEPAPRDLSLTHVRDMVLGDVHCHVDTIRVLAHVASEAAADALAGNRAGEAQTRMSTSTANSPPLPLDVVTAAAHAMDAVAKDMERMLTDAASTMTTWLRLGMADELDKRIASADPADLELPPLPGAAS